MKLVELESSNLFNLWVSSGNCELSEFGLTYLIFPCRNFQKN